MYTRHIASTSPPTYTRFTSMDVLKRSGRLYNPHVSDTAGITLSLVDEPRRNAPTETTKPQLILALECNRPGALSARYDLSRVSSITFGRGTKRGGKRQSCATQNERGLAAETLDIRVPDRWMSSKHARLDLSFGRWVLTDTNSKNGVFVNSSAVQRTVLQDGDLIELGHTVFLFRQSLSAAPEQPTDVDLDAQPPKIPGTATLLPSFAHKLEQLEQIAKAMIPVLLQGESGTGKEVIARAIHQMSGRSGPLVAVNCGAIPSNLVESELFGHKKGAFSGAIDDRPGLVRSAHGGTLFLDEIGDLPAASQAALLRVLQEREVHPVGGTKPVSVDLRVIAATHQDLEQLIEGGGFRQDLFARLAGFRLRLPSLRDRLEDLGLLIGTLFQKNVSPDEHPGFECDVVRAMFGYPWPLNIRELEQTIATALVLSGGDAIRMDHLSERVRDGCARQPTGGRAGSPPGPSAGRPLRTRASSEPASLSAPMTPIVDPVDEQRRQTLLLHLQTHRGNVSAIARAMGKDRKQIQRWLKRYNLSASEYRR